MHNTFTLQNKLGAWAMISLLALILLPVAPVTGCSGSQVTNEINVVLTEAVTILSVADPNAAWVPQLQQAVAALKIAEANWTAGGTVQIVIDCLNTIEAITAVIPFTAVYSPLIAVLVAGIEAILAALPASTTSKLSQNPYYGRYQMVDHWYHTPAGNFKANWNSVAKAHSLNNMLIA
jgi:hypothetical protein